MALALTCPCGARFEVDEVWAGKTISCPDCRQPMQVPALPTSNLPPDDLALGSAVLALLGAFTLVGSAAAVVLGAVAVVRILRRRERPPGLGYAIFGIGAGVVGLTLTVVAMRYYPETFGVGPYFRSGQWADKVDTGGPLTVERPEADYRFSITRPSHQWGVARGGAKFGHGVVDALQLQQPALLMMQTARFAFVDVSTDVTNNRRPLTDYQNGFLDDLKRERPADGEQFDPRPSNAPRVTDVALRDGDHGRDTTKGDLECLEFVVELRCGDQQWTMLVYFCRRKGTGKLYTLRGYAPHRTFEKVEGELRKVLDSFRLLE